ncbi:molybdopterin molybdotransferase MoeA [Actinobacillus suis]|uniref:Molybdopterin molybdenumtransferase n=2 Tax=Actinobacillus suis TaxID=716 RepID=K0G6A2_ACTSU|nr:molybdopterin molybdotransferase MoeA [Actinobacillus suis]AFU19234.1 molybdopterin biosynthesis protein MoeA [Actinobacillus suis H91-0380]AIJ31373.1 molybdopterin biosynthesis protein MoeA [Actinobacillus suis ATCC 33415]MCO4168105.1 molybdopterin molybdotransferase MoeA [Actinobacillus suis]MCQ9629528.1 molybdopterin molybdotransferase MoeA [Actinobacillus suis]MCQ9631562.1 molybdopterin molybdotransferase MoeA [Actinobacillus suis]
MALRTLSEALQEMLNRLPTASKTETLTLAECANRILAEDIFSPINVPSFDNSAMDGYAFRLADLAQFERLTVAGKSFAGNPFTGEVKAGECIRIMTGAMLPADCDVVVMQEETEVETLTSGQILVKFCKTPKLGQNIRRIGEDVKQGALVLAKGSLLNVTTLPLLASLGIAQVPVFSRLKVAILSTGDELTSVGQPLEQGKIYDTNRFAVRLMLEKLNCEILDFGILPDDPVVFEQTFNQAQQQADVLITSGGVSVGEADFTKDVLEKLGEIGFWKIAMKPGKPFAFGKLQHAWFFGLPGNPVSALVTFYQLVQPALAKLAGVNAERIANLTQNLTAIADTNLKKAVGRQDFQRGFYYVNQQGEVAVRPVGSQGSHIFSAFYESNCFIVLEAERGDVNAGEKVTIQPFNSLLR